MSQKRKVVPFRFSAHHDVLLLREVVCQNPYAATKDAGHLWTEVSERLQEAGITVQPRRCRERTALMLDYFRKDNQDMLRRSGTEEDYDEKARLLGEISDLEKEGAAVPEANTTDRDKAVFIRLKAMEACGSSGSATEKASTSTQQDQTRPATRQRKETTVSGDGSEVMKYLKEKAATQHNFQEEELNIRKEELKLAQEKLEHDKARFQLEADERRQRMELEAQERSIMFRMMQQNMFQN